MSAPALADPPAMPTMVSRLPKFSSRPKSQMVPAAAANASSTTRLTNGFYHHPGPAGGNGALTDSSSSVKRNGFLRAPSSFPMKWRKENGAEGKGGAVHQYHSQQKTTTSAGKGRGSGQPVTSLSPQSSPRTLPVSISGSKLTDGTKPTLNGVSGPRLQPHSFARPSGSRPGSGSGPGSRSRSPCQKKSAAGRSYSSDSLGSVASTRLTEDNRFRSRSLNQVRRQPSPTLTPSSSTSSSSLSRPYSLNRTADRGAAAAPRGGLLKPPVSRETGGSKGQSPTAARRSGVPSLLPPSALKKPLLPSLVPASKSSGISYKLSRPSLSKKSRPLRATLAEQEVNGGLKGWSSSSETTTVGAAPDALEADVSPGEGPTRGEGSIVGETLEDMSLSSTSSLDRNDTSQEYMDDFDTLGNGGRAILLLSSKNEDDDSGIHQSCTRFGDDHMSNGVTEAAGLSFLDDGTDWTGLRGEGGRDHLGGLSRRTKSSQPDDHDQGGSSLDLSPSDSCGSGGTYMWDEEGLEPLGGAATTASIHTNSNTTHHIGSFDSDLNSIDVLNNLDSCDLADDDLMLDVDFPEDASLHSDGDSLSHMAQWRRQLCWGTQDVHSDHDSCYKLTEDPGNQRTEGTGDGDIVLDLCPPSLGLDVEDLAEECCAVRSQLEYLQRVLLQDEDVDEDTLTTDTLSPETNDTSRSSDSQMQSLLQEVQQLREELRSRDRTIAQLTLQLTVPTATTRCRCQETTGRTDQHTQTNETERESAASQTPWREHTAIPPVPFLSPPWQYQRSRPYRWRPRPSIPPHLARKRVEELVLYFSDTACLRYVTPPIRKTRNH